MKKIATLIMTAIIPILFFAGPISAASYSFSTGELFSLEHGKYYTWRIDWTIPAGENIESASLVFNQLANDTPASNDLYIQLLPEVITALQVTSYEDNPVTGNIFALSGAGMELAHWSNIPDFFHDVTLDFDLYQIEQLTNFLSDGNFGFGFDPDCLYEPQITFMVETSTEIPIPSTVFLLASGLFGWPS